MGENKVGNFKVSNNVKEGDCCPECKTSWDGGDILEEAVRRKDNKEYYFGNLSDADLIKYAENYGWTPENKKGGVK